MADYLPSVPPALHHSPNRKRARDPATSYKNLSKHVTSCKAQAAALSSASFDDVESLAIPVPNPASSTSTAAKSAYSSIQSRKQINGSSSHATSSTSDSTNGTSAYDSSEVAGNRIQHMVSVLRTR